MFGKLTKSNKLRVEDLHGKGHFNAPRGDHKHQGIDIITVTNEPVFSPIDGVVTRYPFPYPTDLSFKGIEIKNDTFSVKIFYLKPAVKQGKNVKQGDIIGYAQNLTKKYKGITNHIHVEVRNKVGSIINPETLI